MIENTTRVALLALALALAWLTNHAASAQTANAPARKPASQHGSHTRHHRVAARTQLPPPAPAGTQASATTPAPVPNEAVTAPDDAANPHTDVAPSVFQLHYPPQGDGYVTGSSPQAMDDRNAAKATGVQMKVPLPQ